MNETENYNSQPVETAPWDTEKQTFKPNTYLATTIVITLFYCLSALLLTFAESRMLGGAVEFFLSPTFFFSLSFGIIASYKGFRVNDLYNAGLYEEAFEASERARKWKTKVVVWNVIFYIWAFLLFWVS